jgi:hypothetical protein
MTLSYYTTVYSVVSMSAKAPKGLMAKDKAHEAVKHVIEMVLGFTPLDTCPL